MMHLTACKKKRLKQSAFAKFIWPCSNFGVLMCNRARLVQLRTSKDGMIPLTCQLFKGIRKLSTKNVGHLCIKLSFVRDIQASVFIILLRSLFITFPNNQRPMAKVKLWLSQKMTDLKSYHRLAV